MYGKHFASMYTGSMLGAGPDVFAVWGWVISHAVDGEVEVNCKLLAAVIGAPVERIRAAVDYLCAPDPESRSEDHDGRRMQHVAGFTYSVTNHNRYRAIRCEMDRREYNRIKQAEHRDRVRAAKQIEPESVKKTVKTSLTPVNAGQQSAHTEADTESEARALASSASLQRLSPDEKPSEDATVTAAPEPGDQPELPGLPAAPSVPKKPKKESKEDRAERCPVDEILDLYDKILCSPALAKPWPRVNRKLVSDARRQAIRLRWASTDKTCHLEWWEGFFTHITASNFLMNQFAGGIDWLMAPSNFVKVIEGNYHRG